MSPANPKRTLVGPSRFEHGGFKGFRGYFDQCHLLDSGESLSGLCLPRYVGKPTFSLALSACWAGTTEGGSPCAKQ